MQARQEELEAEIEEQATALQESHAARATSEAEMDKAVQVTKYWLLFIVL